jgi:hypothetical protein
MKQVMVCVVAAVFLVCGAAGAHTSRELVVKRPLCWKEFKATFDMPGSQFGLRLDLKPLGMMAAPPLVLVCPQCHLVIWNDRISEDELDRCKSIIEGDDYRRHVSRESRFLLGLLFQGLGKDDFGNASHDSPLGPTEGIWIRGF